MSASTIIGDVTETLHELLRTEQRPRDQFEVSLKSPAEETVDESMKPKVNLYLFRVMENPFAKNQNWRPVGSDILQKPPLTLNLFYVLTPFAAATDGVQGAITEHRVLGEAMRILYDNAIIRGSLLQGGLANTDVELKIDLSQFSLEELTRIWNSFNNPYRLSVPYEVRLVGIDSAIEQSISRVLEKENQYPLPAEARR